METENKENNKKEITTSESTCKCLVLKKVKGPVKNKQKYNKAMQEYPAGIYLFKVNNRNTRTRCEICSKLTINTPERRQWRRSGVFIVNFEHISHLVLVFLLLTLSR